MACAGRRLGSRELILTAIWRWLRPRRGAPRRSTPRAVFWRPRWRPLRGNQRRRAAARRATGAAGGVMASAVAAVASKRHWSNYRLPIRLRHVHRIIRDII